MHARTALSFLRRARALVVVGALATSLATAGAAGAQPVKPPVNAAGKKYCGIPTEHGTLWIEHGATIVDEFGRTLKCEDGTWKYGTTRT